MNESVSRRSLLSSLALLPALGAQQRRPNFLFIFSDDQGYHDVGCYGSEIPTPHIDSIARNGVKFERFYAAGPVCTPSRYGLLTGRYPARSHDHLLGALMPPSQKGIHPEETTIAEVLQGAGYRTAIFGKWHLGASRPEFLPTRHGFQQFDGFVYGCIDYFDFTYGGLKSWYRNEELFTPPKGYTTTYLTELAVRFLRENRRNPFFLYLPYNAPHYGKHGYDPVSRKAQDAMQAPEEYIARFAHITDPNRRVYAAMVAALDDGVGRILSTLRELKLEENTLLVFMSDNGGSLPYGGRNLPLRGQKGQLFEGGIRTPCMVQWKGRIQPGRTSRQAGSGVDFFATFARLAGARFNTSTIDGRDLAPVLFENRTFEREMFWSTGRAEAYMSGDWKYVRNEGAQDYLFNVAGDRDEKNNRIGDRAALEPVLAGYQRVKASLPQVAS